MLPPSKRQRTQMPSGIPQRSMATPLRDEMKINRDEAMDSNWESTSMVSGVPLN